MEFLYYVISIIFITRNSVHPVYYLSIYFINYIMLIFKIIYVSYVIHTKLVN